MNSLRLRLILGFALVAIVPLAIAMTVVSNRIQSAVRAEAAERLDASLGLLQSRFVSDASRMRARLELLSRDPALRRLVLVPESSAEAAEFLDQRRFLLGLDLLGVVDTSGVVVADAANAPSRLGADSEAPRLESRPLGCDPCDLPKALMATAPIAYQGRVVAALRGGVRLDSAWIADLARESGLELVLRGGEGATVATSFGVDGRQATMPTAGPATIEGRGTYLARSITMIPGSNAMLTALASTATADRTIALLRTTSIVFGALGLIVAIALGVLWSHAVSSPVERIARFSTRLASGDWNEPLELRSVQEIETLATALDRMRQDLLTYRERLVAGERHAAWSQMARAVAHEVRNPLTPIAVSVADLKRSYELQRPDFPEVLDQAVRTIGDEIESLKRLLHEFSELGRMPEPAFAPVRVGDVIADLETLYAGDVAYGRLTFEAGARGGVVHADRAQLRQALVNMIKNGLEATASGATGGHAGHVGVSSREVDGQVEIAVADTGAGLTAEQRGRLFTPDFTTKPHGSGLGLTIVHRIVNDHRGTIVVESAEGTGTTFRIRLPVTGAES